MSYSKDQLLQRLKELQLNFSTCSHPAVLTVEAQDKKHRFYIVSALATTPVDLKVLSQRLGLGKGGLRKAPEEALQEILQVPLGSVTPFALVNESARSVGLLLDQGFKAQKSCFFHPLSNEENPPIGKDQPPDLAAYVPGEAPSLPGQLLKPINNELPTVGSCMSEGSNSTTNMELKKGTSQSKPEKRKVKAEEQHKGMDNLAFVSDVKKIVDEIITRTSEVVISEVNKESIQLHGEQLGSVVSAGLKKRLDADLENLIVEWNGSKGSQLVARPTKVSILNVTSP
ncbi:putative prolyl-tRNA synthetase associated domain-containing protein 1 [Nymphaea thermarum]|nr:putative prolyl-tRNA synthetase associated domain-containing protein 1 [Nymphaea thermarum]